MVSQGCRASYTVAWGSKPPRQKVPDLLKTSPGTVRVSFAMCSIKQSSHESTHTLREGKWTPSLKRRHVKDNI